MTVVIIFLTQFQPNMLNMGNRHRNLCGRQCVSSCWPLDRIGNLHGLCTDIKLTFRSLTDGVCHLYLFVLGCLTDGERDGIWWPALSKHWLCCTGCCQYLLNMKYLRYGILSLHFSTSQRCFWTSCWSRTGHYDDVIMSAIASQITSLTIVYSTDYPGADQSKHQSSASLAFVWGIHRGPVNSPHKWPVTRKMFPFDDVIMSSYHWPPLYHIYILNSG